MVSKVWQGLAGAAKAVVKHLDPDEEVRGCHRISEALRSALQQLPVPGSFGKLQRWRHVLRGCKERRSSEKRTCTSGADPGPTTGQHGSYCCEEPSFGTPQRTASNARQFFSGSGQKAPASSRNEGAPGLNVRDSGPLSSVFEDELRGYRVMKFRAVKLSVATNSTPWFLDQTRETTGITLFD